MSLITSHGVSITPQLQLSIEQFYYHEARLLDARQYQQWLLLLAEEIQYIMPSRINVLVDNRDRGSEDMISVERELEDENSDGCPLREENYMILAMRVERAYKMNSWSENPPARTRRIVGNIELVAQEGDRLSVISNFHLFFARPGSENFIYSGQRQDTLLSDGDSYKIAHRKVIMDYSTVELPTLGLLL